MNLIPEEWEKVDISNLCLVEYQQDKKDKEVFIDEKRKMKIKLIEADTQKEVYIGKSFIGQVKEYEKNTKISYYDNYKNKETYIYIDEIRLIDMYSNINEIMKEIEDEQMKEDYKKSVLEEFPENKTYLEICFECEEDQVQFNFITKKYLQSPFDNKNCIIGHIIIGNE